MNECDTIYGIYRNKIGVFMMKAELIKRLVNKVDGELNAYKKLLLQMSAEKIMAHSYETVVKEEFCDILKYDTEKYLSEEKIEKLLKIDNLLDYLYQDWLKFEDNVIEEYEEFIFGYWSREELR